MLVCVGFSLKEDRLQKVRGSGLLSDWDRTDGRTDGRTDSFDFWSGKLSRTIRSSERIAAYHVTLEWDDGEGRW